MGTIKNIFMSIYAIINKLWIWFFIIVVAYLAYYTFGKISQDNFAILKNKERIEELSKQNDSLLHLNELLSYDLNKLQDISKGQKKKMQADQTEKLNDRLLKNQKLIIDNKERINEAISRNEEVKEHLWTHQIEYFAAIIALLVGLIFFANLEHLAKNRMEKEIEKITGETVENIRENYRQFIKHNRLKKDSNIVVINKIDSGFTPIFKKIMKLFYVDLNTDTINIRHINELLDTPAYKQRLKKADVVIIDNQEKQETENNSTIEPIYQECDKTTELTYWPLNINARINKIEDLEKDYIREKIENQLDTYTIFKKMIDDDNCEEEQQRKIQEMFPFFQCTDIASLSKLVFLLDKPLPEARTLTAKYNCVPPNNYNHSLLKCLDKLDDESKKKLKKELRKKICNKIDDLSKQKQAVQNVKDLIRLTDEIIDTDSRHPTALVYFGTDNFPIGLVNPNIKHNITYANAASQLYGNLLNMLKFKNEIENL